MASHPTTTQTSALLLTTAFFTSCLLVKLFCLPNFPTHKTSVERVEDRVKRKVCFLQSFRFIQPFDTSSEKAAAAQVVVPGEGQLFEDAVENLCGQAREVRHVRLILAALTVGLVVTFAGG